MVRSLLDLLNTVQSFLNGNKHKCNRRQASILYYYKLIIQIIIHYIILKLKHENAGILPGAIIFVIALVELILRARTRIFEGFAYPETRRILLLTTDHWQPIYLSTGLHQLTNHKKITVLREG